MADRFDFAFGPRGSGRPGPRRSETDAPFRLLLVGDFSGRDAGAPGAPSAAAVPLERRAILRVDLDNFDAVLARLSPSLRLARTPPVEPTFSTLEDFHPDALLRRLELFRSLRELRPQLQDPARFAQAAAALNLLVAPAGATPRPAPPVSDGAPADGGGAPAGGRGAESDAGAVERLLGRPAAGAGALGGAPGTRAQSAAPAADADAFIRAILAPHLVVDTTAPQRAAYVAAVDAALGDQLRAVLHAKPFQALEANWRGLRWLLANLELDEDLQIHLLDVTAAELLADARAMHADPQSSALRQRLVERPAAAGDDGPHWSALVALFAAGGSDDDLTWLSALGAIGARAGAPLLAGAAPSLLGLTGFDELPDPRAWPAAPAAAAEFWQALRRSELAPWIGLAAPRLLMRQPYGGKTDALESIAFEELAALPEHGQWLWAPAALGCALLLGQSFRERGWEMAPGDLLQIGDLPACTLLRDGERRLQPCAEVLLSERAAEAFGERGIMALASYKDRAEVRLTGFRSIAEPARALSGPWS